MHHLHSGTKSKPKQRQQIVLLTTGAPLRDRSNGSKWYFLALGHHFETTATATHRTSSHWGTTSRPKQRQQIAHLSAGAPLRDQNNGNQPYFLALVHHFETKATATTCTCEHWGTTSRPKQRQQIVLLNTGAPLRDQGSDNKSYFLGALLRNPSNGNK